MKFWFFLLLFSTFLFFSCADDEQKEIDKEVVSEKIITIKTIGGSKVDVANAVVNTLDGGYVIAGYSQSIDGDISDKNTNDTDFLIAKFSSDDILLWIKTFGGTNNDRANDIIETSDGGFAVLGYSKSNDIDVSSNKGSQDFWLIKLDNLGNLIWEKSFGFSGADFGTSLIQTKDNGYLITGVLDVTASGGLGNKNTVIKHAGGDIWAIKLDNLGTIIWQNYFGGSFTDSPFGVVETANNEFVIAGSSDSNDVDIKNNLGTYDFWIIKISSVGNLIWEKSFGGTEIDEARAITTTNNGNFIIVGDTRSNDINVTKNNGAADLWMLKIDENGKLLTQKSFGGSSFDVARSIFKTQNNTYLIAGSSRSLNGDVSKNKGQNDGWILEIDENAKLLWQTTIGGSQIDFFYDAIQLNNGAIIAVGETNSVDGDILENNGFSDVLITKIIE